VAAWLNSIGVTGIILKYRVPRRPDEPKGQPARRPTPGRSAGPSAWVRRAIRQWASTRNELAWVGFSAGGHLAIATATSFRSANVRARRRDRTRVSCPTRLRRSRLFGVPQGERRRMSSPRVCGSPAGAPRSSSPTAANDIIAVQNRVCSWYLALEASRACRASCTSNATAAHELRASAPWTIRVPRGRQACANLAEASGMARAAKGASPLEKGSRQRLQRLRSRFGCRSDFVGCSILDILLGSFLWFGALGHSMRMRRLPFSPCLRERLF